MTRSMFWERVARRVMWTTWKTPRITARATMRPQRMMRRPVGSWTPVQPFSSSRNQWVLPGTGMTM